MTITNTKNSPLIGIVGVCSSGKSTLREGLSAYGLNIRHIAQEHSYVQNMWQRLRNPDILIYLHVSYEEAQQRRKLNWNEDEYQKQIQRLKHARSHADHELDTNKKTPSQVLEEATNFLKEVGIIP